MTFSITFFHDELCFSGFYSGSLCRNLMVNGRNRPNIYHESLTFSLMGGSVASCVRVPFFLPHARDQSTSITTIKRFG